MCATGDKVYSPVIDKGEADVIVSFELLEAARWTEYLKEGGVIVTNTQRIDPMPVITGAGQYPENLAEKIAALGVKIDAFDCLSLARERAARKPSTSCSWAVFPPTSTTTADRKQAIRECVPPKFVELNLKAFDSAEPPKTHKTAIDKGRKGENIPCRSTISPTRRPCRAMRCARSRTKSS